MYFTNPKNMKTRYWILITILLTTPLYKASSVTIVKGSDLNWFNVCPNTTMTFNAIDYSDQVTWSVVDPSGNTSLYLGDFVGASYTVYFNMPGTWKIKACPWYQNGTLGSDCDEVQMTVADMTAVPINIVSDNRCGAGQVNLSASPGGYGGLVRWYDQSGSLVGTGNNFSPTLSTPTTYNVKTYYNYSAGSCESESVPVTGTINSIPGAPTANDQSFCSPGNVPLSATPASGADKLKWYTFGGSYLSTSISYTSYLSSTTTYYISSFNSSTGCESPSRTSISAILSSASLPGTITTSNVSNGNNVCVNGSLTVSVTGNQGNPIYEIIDPNKELRAYFSDHDTHLGNSFDYNFSIPGIWKISTRALSGGCEGADISSVYVTVLNPTQPTSIVSAARCGEGQVTLSASPGSGGNVVRWFDQSGTYLLAGNTYSPIVHETTIFKAKTYYAGCESSSVSVTATVNSIPGVPTAQNKTFCSAGDVTLSGTPGTDANTLQWYTYNNSINPRTTPTTSYTSSLGGSMTYYISSYNSITGCESSSTNRTPITATMVSATFPGTITTNSSNGSACLNSSLNISVTGNQGHLIYEIQTPDVNGQHNYDISFDDTNDKGGTNSFNYPFDQVGTWKIKARTYIDGCIGSDITSVSVFVVDLPAEPGVNSVSRCGAGLVELKANSGSGGNDVNWYDQSGRFIVTGAIYTPTIPIGTTLYTTRTSSSYGCLSTPAIVSATANTLPIPTITGKTTSSVTNSTLYTTEASMSNYTWIPVGGSVTSGQGTCQATVTWSTPGDGSVSVNYVNNSNCAAVTSTSNSVMVYDLPVINLQPVNVAKRMGNSATFSVSATGTNLAYQWRKNDSDLVNAKSSSYTINNVQSSDVGSYDVKITGAGEGIVYSNSATLDISIQGSTDKNYVISMTILQDNVTDENTISSLPVESLQETVAYYDGLGRPIQQVIWEGSPLKKDIVQPVSYDIYGRDSVKYLPYTDGSDGSFKANALTDPASTAATSLEKYRSGQQYSFYQNQGTSSDQYPYSKTVFESSPLNRVFEQGALGAAWQPSDGSITNSGHVQKLGYLTNGAGEVKLWSIENDATCTQTGTYNAGTLFVTQAADENGNSVKEYKDMESRVILKKAYSGTDSLQTYYVYDDYGLLKYVLPPKMADGLSATSLNPSDSLVQALCYYYTYDTRNRMTMKQLPGAAPVYMIYDNRDRVMLTQDGTLRFNPSGTARNQWMFTKYDALNRPILTGLYNDSRTRDEIQTEVNTYTGTNLYETPGAGALGFSIRSFPPKQSIDDYFTVNYYDYYPEWDVEPYYFRSDSSKIDTYKGADGSDYNTNLIGQVTGRSVKIPATGKWLQTMYFYDDKYRVIQTVSNNHLIGGYDIVSFKYDFTGKVLETRNEQYVGLRGGTKPFALYYHTYNSYDHAGRLLKTQQRIAGDSYNNCVTLDSLKYNELGQLMEKNLHGNLQSVDYKYNIRGWLQSINNSENLANGTGHFKPDLFAMKLLYNDTIGGLSAGDEKQYNGNIAAVKWRLDQDVTTKGYAYRYDSLNRILRANFGLAKNNWSNPQYDVSGRNDESFIGYDKNGNILSMGCKDSTSTSGTWLDNLHYRYVGNQLMALGKGGNNAPAYDNYRYYPSGNLQRDEYKNINIYYNELNLPSRVWFGGDNYIDYLYDANGVKLRKEVYVNKENTTSTDYVGNIAYTDGAFDYLITGEGRVTKPSGNFVYEYHLKDHLGNTRVAFEATSSTSLNVTQRVDYYPFGLQFKSKLSGTSNNKYLYNGKEMQDDVIITASLNWLDYGARFYDPQIGRWTTPDPLAEKYFHATPFNYVENNPVSRIDPDGRYWNSQADEDIANKQIDALWKRSEDLRNQEKKLNKQIANLKNDKNLSEKERNEQIASLSGQLNDVKDMNSAVQQSYNEMFSMAFNQDIAFTFHQVNGNIAELEHGTNAKGDLLITVNNVGSFESKTHELTHAYQVASGEQIPVNNRPKYFTFKNGSPYPLESEAYSRQFAVGGSATLPWSHAGGTPQKMSDITPGWVSVICLKNGNNCAIPKDHPYSRLKY
jgi:RHS repeat-associated protein